MALFGTKRIEEKPESGNNNSQAPASLTRVSGAPARGPAVGIDHAIMLMRQLPTDKNVDLVVRVLKTTLESLNVRVVDIVADAARRQQEIEGRVSQLKSEIATLEQEIAKRTDEIDRLEAVHARARADGPRRQRNVVSTSRFTR
jgi:hypothetical protein